eukprot:gnl/TRDRNA2_/TRDRNA2_135984_c0_seq1.p1 gnl/TRDRNA2_/TRDRNA2_135984_c0~~gnl/TRDRNA2_/TRDRNA2_135984_c0_seq1.p1  ORF type:complete len:527 (-),score=94.07 gnl/TRDRNA2_/TRDRNA2_135984_c0_seq1:55-1545(-)
MHQSDAFGNTGPRTADYTVLLRRPPGAPLPKRLGFLVGGAIACDVAALAAQTVFSDDQGVLLLPADLVLALVFCGEICARACWDIRAYLCGHGIWGLVDVALAAVSAACAVASFAEQSPHRLHLVRLVRVLRLFGWGWAPLRSCRLRQPRVVTRAATRATAPLAWATVMLVALAYVGGVMATALIGRGDPVVYGEALRALFPSIVRSALTLLVCLSDGGCATVLIDPLLRVGWRAMPGVVLLLALGAAALATVAQTASSIVAETVAAAAEEDLYSEDETAERKALVESLKAVAACGVRPTSEQQEEVLTREAYLRVLDDNEALRKAPSLLGLSIPAAELFDQLDVASVGRLPVSAFAQGVLELQCAAAAGPEATLPLGIERQEALLLRDSLLGIALQMKSLRTSLEDLQEKMQSIADNALQLDYARQVSAGACSKAAGSRDASHSGWQRRVEARLAASEQSLRALLSACARLSVAEPGAPAAETSATVCGHAAGRC